LVAFEKIQHPIMIQKITAKIKSITWLRKLVRFAKTHTMPGFQGVPIFYVFNFMRQELGRHPITMRANAIAFSFFLSLFPSLILLISLIPYLPFEKTKVIKEITIAIDELMPNNAGRMVTQTIKDFLHEKRSDIMSIGFGLAIYFSSNGVLALMGGFEKSYPIFGRRSPLDKRIRAIVLTFALGGLMVTSMILIILGNQLIHEGVNLWSKWTKLTMTKKALANSLLTLRWVVVILLLYMGSAFIYRFGIMMRRKLPFFSPGAVLATLLSMLSSIIFSTYVDNFGNYNKLYGSIGTIIVLMLWMQLNAMILVFGFELNASIALNRQLQEERVILKRTENEDDFEAVY
jgi:membrane protein